MYCHGMAALALTQVYGMTGDEDVKKVTKKAIDLIVKTQNNEGGWRYDPSPDRRGHLRHHHAGDGPSRREGLRACTCPDKTMNDSIKYINKCHDPRSGGYRYQPYSAGPGYARTAAGVCVLQLCGEYEADEIKKAVEYMERTGDDRGHYWYGHYYAAHALNQVGGETWEKYYKKMRDMLLGAGLPAGRPASGTTRAAKPPTAPPTRPPSPC